MTNKSLIKVMIDSNIIISSIFNINGTPYLSLKKAANPPYSLVLCSQIIDEVRRIFNRKFPTKILDVERFLSSSKFEFIRLNAEDPNLSDEVMVRDVNDRPILRVARKAKVEIFITGDKDFLESGIKTPQILTAAQFITQ